MTKHFELNYAKLLSFSLFFKEKKTNITFCKIMIANAMYAIMLLFFFFSAHIAYFLMQTFNWLFDKIFTWDFKIMDNGLYTFFILKERKLKKKV